jgi:hypothetical protein
MTLFNQNKMLTETLDLATCWEKYSLSEGIDVRNYYLTEALLAIKSENEDKFYSTLILKAFKEIEGTPMHSLSLMKAYLKENNGEAAYKVYKVLNKNRAE